MKGKTMPKSRRDDASKEGQSLVQYVVERITKGVEQGRYVPGQRLIAADLAEEFDVSRAPVREALHVLAGEGVVDLTPNRGAMIRKVSNKELIDLLDFTEAICVLGVRLATPKMNRPKNRKIMDAAVQRIRDAYDNRIPLPFIRTLYQYHVDLNEISGNFFVNFFYRRVPFHFFNPLFAEAIPSSAAQWDGFMKDYEHIHAALLTLDPHISTTSFITHMQWVISLVRK
ncbi:MAG: GntR family transcriptional regulator [Rhodospirillaceae bacterium]|nr:GntR family transcriptional regulator [Rhodospirillaceae bacterium]